MLLHFKTIAGWALRKLDWIGSGMCFFLGVLAMIILLLIAARIEPALAEFLGLTP